MTDETTNPTPEVEVDAPEVTPLAPEQATDEEVAPAAETPAEDETAA